ncbi:MAG: DUF2231 domain-containing protein [Thermoanaerobaculaceae bacterium]
MIWLPDPLHPAVVHFPIALTFVALLFELLAFFPKLKSLSSASPLLLALAALSSVAAVLSGEAAKDAAVIPAAARKLVEQHEELGEKVMYALLVLAVLRLMLFRLERFSTWVRVVFLALLLAVAVAVGYNGKLGGELVFQHGVGTVLSFPSVPPSPQGADDGD